VLPALRIAHEAPVISLDPADAMEAATQSVLSNFYEALVGFDRGMKLVPTLAADWTAPDERTWVFRLRPGVRFHDGAPLTASDVVFSLDRARSRSGSRVRGQLHSVESVAQLDAGAVRIVTTRPDPLLVNRLAYILIVPRRAVALKERPIGTGPYRFVRRDGNVLEAEGFPGHWRGAPEIPRVQFTTLERAGERDAALREGRVDVLRFVPPALARALAAVPGVRVLRGPSLTSVYLWFHGRPGPNGGINPFADRRVRQAVSLALDRERIVAQLEGMAHPAHQLVAVGIVGHSTGAPELPFDPSAARRLLHEAGHGRGLEAPLRYAQGAPAEATVARLIEELLREVDIRSRPEPMDWPALVAAWQSGRLSLFVAGWRFESGDALSFFEDCLHSRDVAGRGEFNPGFSDSRLDAQIEATARAPARSARLLHYRRLAQLAAEEMPLAPLYVQQDVYGASAAVCWQPRLDAKLLAAEMSFGACEGGPQ
jgi:peptide/nickel transport system substrate-binding protein